MASNQAPLALRHIRRALSRWPKETLRPDVSFSRTILAAKGARLSPPTTETDSTASPDAFAPASKADVAAELEQANALYTLLEDRYAIAYRAPSRITRPAGAPEHYERLLREIDEAPARGFLGRALGRIKRMVRWS